MTVVGTAVNGKEAVEKAEAIKLTHAGIYQLDPSVAGKLVAQLNVVKSTMPKETVPVETEHDLTERELEVLRLIATGATNREIADELFISEGTVKNHVSNILSRLGLRDRIQAAIYAHENHLT